MLHRQLQYKVVVDRDLLKNTEAAVRVRERPITAAEI